MQELAAQFDVGERDHRTEVGQPVTSASRRQAALNGSPAFSSPRPPAPRPQAAPSKSSAKPAAKAGAPRSKPATRPAAKGLAKARSSSAMSNGAHVSDDVFPMSAAAMIPFDDDDNGSDDILGSF